ncbi:recombinase family protein [Bradyrhizobium aeschynomenes]|uniref:recombinase family protein n=1 Tax=Bradyrhizobium aeschynomenes TaxID=2734909 RepID=UPI0024BF5763|nr:recombinase family protein [Bradyrhizobium aeschynomenes]
MKYGYARVSTTEQDHAAQVDALALRAAGAVKVFSEKMSGVRADRPQLARAIAALDQGDVLAVTRIDRLARSSRDLLNIVHEVEARGPTFEVSCGALGQYRYATGGGDADHAGSHRPA